MTNFAVPMELPKFSAALRDAKSAFAPSRLAACVALSLAEDYQLHEAESVLLALLHDEVEELRVQAVESLAVLGHRFESVGRNEKEIARLLDDPSMAVRCAVIESAHVLLSSPVALLIDVSKSADEQVRCSAVVALGQTDTSAASSRLEEMLSDSSMRVQKWAALALRQKGNAASVSILENLVATRDEHCLEAIEALGVLAAPSSLPLIEKLANARWGGLEVKAMAAAALMRFEGKTHQLVEPASKLLRSRRRTVRLAMLRAAAILPSDRFREELIFEVENSARTDEQSEAVHAIGQLARTDAVARQYLELFDAKNDSILQDEITQILTELTHELEAEND